MPDDTRAIEAALAAVLQSPVRIDRRAPVSGGDISRVERIVTSAGTFIAKSLSPRAEGFFEAEAAGLDALRASGTSLRVPSVVALVNDGGVLVLEDLGQGTARPDHAERAGRGLAELHRASSPRFGFARDGFCGATPQSNRWTDRWIEFYREQRLGAQLARARDAHLLSAGEAQVIGRLLDRLDTLLDEPAEGPALVHGDLWSGNLHVAGDGAPGLIDPAACYAHREAEFGMMTLFGGFPVRLYDAYEESYPLAPGWRQRTGLYQLYHLLNHLNLFGPGYHAQVMTVARRY